MISRLIPSPSLKAPATASFPPENYDPESSSSDASNHADSAIASPGFPITERQSFSAGQASENVPFIQENAPVQELVSTRENVTNGQLAADQAYYAALEEARQNALGWQCEICPGCFRETDD